MNAKCRHNYKEANKYLVSKIEKLLLHCQYKIHGCQKVLMVSGLEEHEKACQFNKFDSCDHEHSSLKISSKHNPCPLELVESGLVCYGENKQHNCSEWVHSTVEGYEDRIRILKREKYDFETELSALKQESKLKIQELEGKLKDSKEREKELKDILQEERKIFTNKINELKSVASPRLMVISKNNEERVKSFWGNVGKDYEKMKNKMENSTFNFIENIKTATSSYNNFLNSQAKSSTIRSNDNPMTQSAIRNLNSSIKKAHTKSFDSSAAKSYSTKMNSPIKGTPKK